MKPEETKETETKKENTEPKEAEQPKKESAKVTTQAPEPKVTTQAQTTLDYQKIIDLDETKASLLLSEISGILQMKNPYKTKATLIVDAMKRYS